MSHFQYHLFFCNNQREAGEPCCNDHGAQAMRDYCKQRVKQLGATIPGNVRINSAGCLGRCEKGPLLVVYPEAIWYTYIDQVDIDEIIEVHLMQGRIVERLRID